MKPRAHLHSPFSVLGSRFVIVLLFLSGCQRLPADDDFGAVPDFALTDHNGKIVRKADLNGKVWVAACVFTRCTGACPQITGQMVRLQHELRDQLDVVLVSLSVDPEHDTPEVLREYAERQGAQDRWLFLTGPKEQVYSLIQDGFKLTVRERTGAERTPGNEVDHNNRLTLVDRRGVKRGFYDATEGPRVHELLQRVPAVLADSSLLFPTLNASLNGAAGVLLLVGWFAIRRQQVGLHKACMLLALATSAIFLGCYLYYHIVIKAGQPTRFAGPDLPRTIYLVILVTHTSLAAIVAPLGVYIAYLGIRNRLERHVRLARWTLPIWLYVSVTGVVVYWMLYHLYPPGS